MKPVNVSGKFFKSKVAAGRYIVDISGCKNCGTGIIKRLQLNEKVIEGCSIIYY